MPVARSRRPDTKLYDILEVSPDATSAQIAKVMHRHDFNQLNFILGL